MLEAPSHDGQHSVPRSLLDHQMLLHHGQGQSQRTPLSRGQYIEGQELGTLTAVPCQGHAVPPYSQAYAGSGRNAGLFCALPQELKLPFFQHVQVAHAGVIGCLALQLVEQLVRQPKGHCAQHVLLLLHVPQWELRIVQRWPVPVLGQLAQNVPLARDLVLSLAGKSSHVFDMAGARGCRILVQPACFLGRNGVGQEQIADSKSQPLVGWHLLQVGVAALARQHIALKLRLFVALQSTSKNSAL